MDPRLLLCIESSTEVCSVALFDRERLLCLEEAPEANRHAEILAVLIEKALNQAGIKMKDLAAVAVSNGPGSYTSLRVGLSTAKGICFGTGIPLIAIPSDRVLIHGQVPEAMEKGASHIIAMIDARRMEAYCTIYDIDGLSYSIPTPVIFDKNSFRELAHVPTIAVCGNGSKKWCDFIEDARYISLATSTSATFMGALALERISKGSFDDIARVSPEYIKPPNITLSKKNLGLL